jgi:AcrR family transcriptional regulator
VDRPAAPHREGQEDIIERRILNAAAHLIAERGLPKMNIGSICARSGYARVVIFQHFGDPDTVAQRLVEYLMEEFHEAYGAAVQMRSGGGDATPMQMLKALLDVLFRLMRDMPVLYQAFLTLWGDAAAGNSAIRPTLTEVDRRFRFAIAQTIAAGVADGSIVGVQDADSYASALLGQLRGISMQVLIDPDGIDLGAVRAELDRDVDRLDVRHDERPGLTG